ncbi:MAG: transglycosylase SLT domain-containing protein [Gemmatimonadaceae bacterium]
MTRRHPAFLRTVVHAATVLVAIACGQGPADAANDGGRRVDAVPGTHSSDSVVRLAAESIRQGRPFRATRMLEAVLRDPKRRSPDAILLAATAAERWGGWSQVKTLLADAPWIDSAEDGLGRELLAVAALESGDTVNAAREAGAAVRVASTATDRARRLVYLARALDRLDQRDSARTIYQAAADLNPAIADWLRLRAAGVTADSAARHRLYENVHSLPATARIAWTDAQARERAADFVGAAARYAALGAPVAALRARLAATADTESRRAVRRELVDVVRSAPGTADARLATEILDRTFTPLLPDEELAIGRSGLQGGGMPPARTEQALGIAVTAGLGAAEDRLGHATILARLGRHRDAASEFARVQAPRPIAAAAAYHRARSLLAASDRRAARGVLTEVARTYGDVPTTAASALALLADLATDDQDDRGARVMLLDLARRYPKSPHAVPARFRAALIALADGDAATAATELDALPAARSEERLAGVYWAGRAWEQRGDGEKARERWRAVRRADPLSYYSVLAGRRLGDSSLTLASPAFEETVPGRASQEALVRAAHLERLGMDVEARIEYEFVVAAADSSVATLLAAASALERSGQVSRSIHLAQRARARAGQDSAAARRAARLLYPIRYQGVIDDEARRRSLDAPLIAALIRQESGFNPHATSIAGARGLMQLMPAVGQTIAKNLGYPVWESALLFQADVNIELGTAHLARLVRTSPDLSHVLAGYNAGESRVTRWSAKTGAADPEMFTERIPFAETRDYVRIVQANRAVYAAAYRWVGAAAR